ncbi:hypothetical protein RCL_jg17586.t1 [Rhizophagus clarus]|uniref:Uncharacterized protein n=1 Tax=Rhizophagus clarus TaxID=94130 RepID=A0A8H3L8B1_9GLOM|nr:hypothetical protein RCL_jg17586.t1 [Rhizophagus clarus]
MLLRYNKGAFSNNAPITSDSISTLPHSALNSCSMNNFFITHAIVGSPTLKNCLISLFNQLANCKDFTFYTDGLVMNLGTLSSSMGFGWLQVHHAFPRVTFSGKTIFLTSLT